ncbi:PNPLA4 [Bugula neritina]|uniref:PNPLA4 n=1 Tax=Bugula neritina TaxID=10212 RepID=A0A7J7KP78_BUGNE|nr:PNPLA4 [Bugula neritina]
MAVCPEKVLQCKKLTYDLAESTRKLKMGALNPQFNLSQKVEQMVDMVLPSDAHLAANGRVYISVTRKKCGKNFVISSFNSREDLIQCLVSSCHIPLYSGKNLPVFRGEKYYDGGFTNNLIDFDEGDTTLSITPFSGGLSYVCPNDPIRRWNITLNNQLFCVNYRNLSRAVNALFPPSSKTLNKYYEQGFIDALIYLAKSAAENPDVAMPVLDSRLRHKLTFSRIGSIPSDNSPDADCKQEMPSSKLENESKMQDILEIKDDNNNSNK